MARARTSTDYTKIVAAKRDVLQRYQRIFQRQQISQLNEEDIRSFLIFKNNQHWAGLQRLGPAITRDMPALRDALNVLFDESRPIEERVDYAHSRVPRLAQAVITPLLLISNPAKYGVWNSISAEGLLRIGLLPESSRQATLGERYTAINETLLRLSRDLGLDLWSLDAVWWTLGPVDDMASSEKLPERPPVRIWIEITELLHGHGGPGWELGTCLWSPTRNNSGAKSYELMREPKRGDLVVHFVTPADSRQRRVWGLSYVASETQERADEPPNAGKWTKRNRYYRIPLEHYHEFKNRLPVENLVERNRDLLREEAEEIELYPFSKYGASARLAQGRYLARCTPRLYEAIREMMDEGVSAVTAAGADLTAITADFAAALREANISFGQQHDALARTFLCSLAAKRFVILTGLSGSGKTQLALKFGQWLGERHYELIAVRPDWTGPEALLGYEDALLPPAPDGRRAWCVPQPLELFLRAARDPGTPYLLILDEMNLAHVERYFADVLSGIESEEPILPDLRDENGAWRPAKRGLRLPFPENVFIVGTVNVDETTYLFSPKVLDRANTIEFRVATEDLPLDPATARKPLPARAGVASLVAGFLEIATDDDWQLDHAPEFLDQYVQHVRELHRRLGETRDEFGHRTFFEGIRLAALLAHAGDVTIDEALDIFVLQKVLPRLHGSRRRLEPVLRCVAEFCINPGVPNGTELDASPNPDAKLGNSYAKVQRMFHAMKVNQFASFSD
jgi:AAA domain (dynein-related subfamily)